MNMMPQKTGTMTHRQAMRMKSGFAPSRVNQCSRAVSSGILLCAATAAAGDAKPVVLVAEKLGSAGITALKEFAEVDTSYTLTPEQLLVKAAEVDAIIVRSATKITRAVFEASKGRLKVVGRAGVGIDNVDLNAATEYGCLVVNAPTANTIAAAEHGISLLTALARNVAQADASMKKGKWDRSLVGVSLIDKTLAIIGFGKVGNEVARRAKGLGLTLIAFDPYASVEKAAAVGVELVSFDEALARGDYFSLHMPLTAGTKNLFNDEAFAKIKKGARIINVARGGVIDEAALVRALDSKQVAGAALDVFAEEPPKFEGHALIGRPDVICTPHLGASTVEAQEGVSIEIVDAVVEALQGKLSANAVNAPMVSPEVLAELKPYISLAEGLGKAAIALADGGFTDLTITYSSPRGDDIDTRLLRAMVLKGILEVVTEAKVNLVNADLLAKKRGLRISEVKVSATGSDLLGHMSVALHTKSAKFSSAVNDSGNIFIEGHVRNGTPFINQIGEFDVELPTENNVLLIRNKDQPGMVGKVGTALSKDSVNINFMTCSRLGKGKDAVMAIGIDTQPSAATLKEIGSLTGIEQAIVM